MRPGCGAGAPAGAAASFTPRTAARPRSPTSFTSTMLARMHASAPQRGEREQREEVAAAHRTRYGWYVPGTMRVPIATRFHALIAITATVSAASSASSKCLRTSS